MAKCADCKGNGCEKCSNRGWISDCKEKEHWGMIDGKRYPLVLDPGSRAHRINGNRIIRDLLDAASEGKKFGLNEIACKHGIGEYSTEELLELYMKIGYSMSGLSELDFFSDLEMDCCDWQK